MPARNVYLLRALAIALALGVVSLIPIAGWLNSQPDPVSGLELALTFLLPFVPFLSFGALILLTRWLVRKAEPPRTMRQKIRLAVWLSGPIGCAWAVFALTGEQGDPLNLNYDQRDRARK